jgi:histone H1/5
MSSERKSLRLQEQTKNKIVMLKTAKPAAKKKSETKSSRSNKSKSTTKTKPTYLSMIMEAIINLGERGGSSRQAIEKYILANFDVSDPARVRQNIRTNLKNYTKTDTNIHGCFIQSSQSFRVVPSYRKKWLTPLSIKSKTTQKKKTKTSTKSKSPSTSTKSTKKDKDNDDKNKKKKTLKADPQQPTKRYQLKSFILDEVMKAHDSNWIEFDQLLDICLKNEKIDMDDEESAKKLKTSLKNTLQRCVKADLIFKNKDNEYSLHGEDTKNDTDEETETDDDDQNNEQMEAE